MNAAAATAVRPEPVPMVGLLRLLLWVEAIGGIAITVLLSILAARTAGNGDIGAEEGLRFAAGGAFVMAILCLAASRGARRRRPWAWTLAAMLQVVIAVATGVAVLVAEWHPLYLVAFATAVVVMLVLSSASVRRALGQS